MSSHNSVAHICNNQGNFFVSIPPIEAFPMDTPPSPCCDSEEEDVDENDFQEVDGIECEDVSESAFSFDAPVDEQIHAGKYLHY